ncbi:MAG: rnr [Gammaproteobacteria bacterium]|jgi:ribonuclease R|nr:rnr [Gammaproteobacteria bacterium]
MRKKIKKKDPYREREAQKYEHPIASREFILDLLAERESPITYKQLIAELDLTDPEAQEALRRRLLAMVRDGQLLQNRRGAFGLIDKMELLKGYVIGHKDGFGFVVPEEGGEDLFLSARQMRTVFPNDEVLVRVANIDSRGRREGVIAEVLVRHTHELVGRFISKSDVFFVQPANQRINHDILIPQEARQGAQQGQMVVVQITEQPSMTMRPVGKIVKILGDHMAPGMEIDVAIRNHELPYEWPEKVLAEAEKFSPRVPDIDLEGRFDARKLPFVTIDGEDAKDFDDAVYCEARVQGGWILYVAIADVSHYVKPYTELDKESLNRGNSVYFPGQVIPMLPEVLSNELCSLKPEVNRLTLICKMEITPTGKIADYQFHEGVIYSHARLTYNQVHAIVAENDVELQKRYKKLLPHLKELFSVYRTLHAARLKRGAIDFDLPETKIIFSSDRKIERIVALTRNDAHRLIEECMLCANICAARFLMKHKCPSLFRVHEGPTPVKLMDLRKFLGELGLALGGGEEPTSRDYAKLLEKIADRPEARLIQTVLLRSLSQAVYSPDNKGHFGLAFDAYAHFTSPIRRYPDLLVHRGIRKILRGEHTSVKEDALFSKYGEHCSMTERRADDATREAVDWLKCEFMQDKVGEEFSGMITSVTSFGLFVELTEVYVEGLIHISMLRNDYYQFDPVKHALLGERSGKRYRLGDAVKIKVVRVDLDQRQIDFVITDELVEVRPIKKKRPKKKSL